MIGKKFIFKGVKFMEKLKYFVNGEFKDSKTEVWYDLHNPSRSEERR